MTTSFIFIDLRVVHFYEKRHYDWAYDDSLNVQNIYTNGNIKLNTLTTFINNQITKITKLP